jgi:hypothetical protein
VLAQRTTRRPRRQTIYIDPARPVSVSVGADGKLCLAASDHDTGRNVSIIVPASVWPAVARAIGGHLAFREIRQRRDHELSQKSSNIIGEEAC